MMSSKLDITEDTSICSTISGETIQKEKQLKKAAALGWSEENYNKIDEVWKARDDVEDAKNKLHDVNEEFNKIKIEYKAMKSDMTQVQRKLLPKSRKYQTLRIQYYSAKHAVRIAEQKLKQCILVLDSKKEIGKKLGLNVVPVPESICIPINNNNKNSLSDRTDSTIQWNDDDDDDDINNIDSNVISLDDDDDSESIVIPINYNDSGSVVSA